MIDVCDIQVMKPMLAAHGFHFSKAKGQNFLIAPWVPQSIAEQAGVDETAGVLEIGPGIGPLTQQLCLRAGKVCAVEVDERLKPILDVTVGNFSNLEILWGDVLKQDIPALVKEKFGTLRPMACANLPYYITSPILTALLEAECFQSVTVMVQKEVAQRIAAKPGAPDYSAFCSTSPPIASSPSQRSPRRSLPCAPGRSARGTLPMKPCFSAPSVPASPCGAKSCPTVFPPASRSWERQARKR